MVIPIIPYNFQLQVGTYLLPMLYLFLTYRQANIKGGMRALSLDAQRISNDSGPLAISTFPIKYA